MTDVLLEAVKDGLANVREQLRREREQLRGEMDELAQKMETAGGESVRGYRADPLAALGKSDEIKSMAARQSRNAVVRLDGGVSLLTKSLLVGDTAGSSEEGYNVQPQRMAGLANDPRRALTLLDYLPSVPVSSNSFEFNKLSGYSSNAGYQASEGAEKPEATIPTELATANIATIANWVPASEQVLADAPALRQQVSSLLGYGVRAKLERELILGAGGTGQIAGLTDSGNFTAYALAASDDNLADAVSKIEAEMIAAGWRPNLIVINPADWGIARREREYGGGGQGLYVAGSWRDPAPPSIWGIPVVVNPAITQGDILMMDTSQVAVLNRQDVTIELGRINDQFTRNVVTIRAELRAGLAVFSPGAVVFGSFEA